MQATVWLQAVISLIAHPCDFIWQSAGLPDTRTSFSDPLHEMDYGIFRFLATAPALLCSKHFCELT